MSPFPEENSGLPGHLMSQVRGGSLNDLLFQFCFQASPIFSHFPFSHSQNYVPLQVRGPSVIFFLVKICECFRNPMIFKCRCLSDSFKSNIHQYFRGFSQKFLLKGHISSVVEALPVRQEVLSAHAQHWPLQH